jgi:tripartite-type tricarboxylate transporter receptor subunit TctC
MNPGWCMLNSQLVIRVLSFSVLVSAAHTASGQATSTGSGQAYPSKPVRIVTSEAGGGSDLVVRLLAQKLTAGLGQAVIVENRGGGVIPGEIVSRSPPDGYTLLYYGSTLWMLPLMRKDVPYDVLRDFAPITTGTSSSNILVVHPSLPLRSVKELITLAKSRPGQLNYASGAPGTANHLAAALFVSMSHAFRTRALRRRLTQCLAEKLN